ncbi:MAG: ATP-binding cassette domain-containing protein [Candidatus Hodarchaeales archaeon]|jgi:ABC-2 type transport system ATP-binding protein
MIEPVIKASNITKNFQVNFKNITALRDVSFICKSGTISLLIGDNGSGKTTLLRIISGLIKPSEGSISVQNSIPSKLEIQKLIGYLPETVKFHKGISGFRFLEYLARLKQIHNPKLIVERWLTFFEISKEWQKMPPALYSKGMKERIGLAIAFMGDPQILLLDEPLENLDHEIRIKTLELIDKSAHNDQKTILIATHNKDDFRDYTDQILHLKEGRLC